jgi:hypothetical protein
MQMGYFELVSPGKLGVSDEEPDCVYFCWECQSCLNFAVRTRDMVREDPQVYADRGEGPEPEDCTVSEFLLRFFVDNALSAAPYRRHYTLTRAQSQRFGSLLVTLQVKGKTYMPVNYFAGAGLLAKLDLQDGKFRFEAAARTDYDLNRLEAILGVKGTVAD